jgi:hypothetical protein
LNGSALRVSGAISNRSLINSGSLFFIRGAPIHSLCNQSSGRLQSEVIILHQAGGIRWHTGQSRRGLTRGHGGDTGTLAMRVGFCNHN